MALNKLNNQDNFKQKSKFFKSFKCGHSFENNKCNLIDLRYPHQHRNDLKKVNINSFDYLNLENSKSTIAQDFENPLNWEMYSVVNAEPGLYAIPKIMTNMGSQKWFNMFLYEIPKRNHLNFKSNLNLNMEYDKINELSKLRWLTFGYHYNWDSKLYSRENQSPIINEITSLFEFIINRVQFKLKIEAGIVNYYTCKSTLNPHSDHSEMNQTAPLLSLSLGSASAIFLIDGQQRSDRVKALLLNKGDLLIMSSSSRLSYHSVTKVICDEQNCDGRKIKRINLNIRQVY